MATTVGAVAMKFPVTIWFHSLGWTSKLSVTDEAGTMLGFSPLVFGPERCLAIYSDESMARQIYAVQWTGSPGRAFVLLDESGSQIGTFAAPKLKGWSDDGTYVIGVGSQERFEIVEQSPRLHLVDFFIDPVPVFNVLTGMLIQPCHLIRRQGGGETVLTMVKHRTMFDASYRLELTGSLDGRERECIMLASIMVAIRVRRFAPSWW